MTRRVRLVRHILDETALSRGTIKRALRPTQHFDARKVEGIDIGTEKCAIGLGARHEEGNIVDGSSYGSANATNVLAADDDARLTGINGLYRKARNLFGQIEQTGIVAQFKFRCRDGRNGHRHVF